VKVLGGSDNLATFVIELHYEWRNARTANITRWRYFYTAFGKYIGIVPPCEVLMHSLPFVV
jgi:hypothetical protein